jgi:glycine/D-amino acid oxidase-like deaminating enzyme
MLMTVDCGRSPESDRNRNRKRPAASMMESASLPEKADAVVIGGGIIGASILYHLSKRKIRAVLLEKGEIASGSSGACDGLIFLQSKKPGPHLSLALESAKRFASLKQELPFDVEHRNNGGMIVIENDRELRALEPLVAGQRSTGLNTSLLDGGRAREKEPALSEEIVGATFCPLDAQVNPLLLVHAFVRSAKEVGGQVITDSEVVAIEVRSNRVTSVQTKRGVIETGTVINAAGSQAPQIGKLVHLEIPIKPRRGQLLVTEPVSPIVGRGLLSAKYIAAKFDFAPAGTDCEGISINQTASGNLLVGSTREFVGFDKGTTYQAMRGIAREAVRIIPQLRGTHIIRVFSGLRPYTPDGLPILGKVEGIDGFIMAAGHEGDGIALSPITGETIAELIDTGDTPISISAFGLERFHS